MLHRLLATTAFVVITSFATAASPLADAPSAFLRAHADSPVQWMLWGDAAFARAKAEDKPVYLAIGAFTSELSRAMRTQSFAREENAALLNENFVCILVDRDDEPALAALAQHYLNTVKQAQGWPLNLWLTPEMKPFEGASYLPPSDEWGKEGFANAAKRVLAAWQGDPAAQRAKADEAVAAQVAAAPGVPEFPAGGRKQLLADSTAGWLAIFDAANGGFGDPPKYPQPELLRFLLRGDKASRAAAEKTLRAIATNPLRDPLDGGFFRYASDGEWKLPYVQKTLADQARLALAFLDAAQVKPDPLWNEAARGALNYAQSLGAATHGFAAAEDGTPENVLPSFLWTADQFNDAVGGSDLDAAQAAFGVTVAGNLAADAYLGVETAGKNLLHPPTPADPKWFGATGRLVALRHTRPTPLRDDVATAGAHGLLLAALARAGAELPEPRFAAAAKVLSGFMREHLITRQGKLLSRPGRTTLASPRDHALVIDGLLTYHAISGDAPAGESGRDLAVPLTNDFGDRNTERIFAAAVPLSPGLWARVHTPAPDNADLPGAESATLLALLTHKQGGQGQMALLATAIAQEMNESPNIARGDQLLALQVYVQAP